MLLKSLHVVQKKRKKKKGIIYQQQYLDAFCGKLTYSFLRVSTLSFKPCQLFFFLQFGVQGFIPGWKGSSYTNKCPFVIALQ